MSRRFSIFGSALFLSVVFSGISTHGSEPVRQVPDLVSMIDLIANGEKYDGHLVEVGGILSFSFEDDAIFLSKMDAEVQSTKNAIWIDLDEATQQKLKKYNGHYGFVVGRFSANKCGHMCLFHSSMEFVSLAMTYDVDHK